MFDDLFLEPYGNRIPNVRVELVRADLYFTSEPYPIHVLEQLTAGAAWTGGFSWMPPDESLDAACTLAGGALTATVSYGSYTNWPAESLDAAANCTGGALTVTAGYVTYSNYAAESLDASCNLVSGSLS